jgi:hypothetical protein
MIEASTIAALGLVAVLVIGLAGVILWPINSERSQRQGLRP